MKKYEKLNEQHLLKAGGIRHTDIYDNKSIELVIGERKTLKFFNYGDGFNIYVCESKPECYNSIQLLTIETVAKFKRMMSLLYDKEGVALYNELSQYKNEKI